MALIDRIVIERAVEGSRESYSYSAMLNSGSFVTGNRGDLTHVLDQVELIHRRPEEHYKEDDDV